MGNRIDGGELVARTLRQFGVEYAFGLHGGHLNSLLMGFRRNDITVIDTRHEAVAVNAADGYSRASGELGVAFATASAGFTNSLAGVGVAFADRIPLLVLTSSPPLRDAEMNEAQGILAQAAIAAPMTKWSHQVTTVEEIPRLVGLAIRKAFSDGGGPVLLDFPIDVLFTSIDEDTVVTGGGNRLAYPPAPSPAALHDALDLLHAAERPAIIAGQGALHTDGKLARFAETSGIPVFSEMGAHGVLPSDHPRYGFGALALGIAPYTELGAPDVVLLIGARTGVYTDARKGRIIPAAAKLIHVDPDSGEIGRILPTEVGITADVNETLSAFLADGRPWEPRTAWTEGVVQLIRYPRPYADNPVDLDGRIHPYHAMRELLRLLPERSHLIADGSDTTHWLDEVMHDGTLASGLGYGGYLVHMGIGFGLAIGRRVADPDSRPILLTGDGSFGFHSAEVDTMVRHKLPIITIVFNNAVWGSSIWGQQLYYGEEGVIASRLLDTDYDQVATGFGAHGERVKTLDELAGALERALRFNGPSVINVNVANVVDSFAAQVLDWTDDPDTTVVPYYTNIPKRK
ncbi:MULTISPECIES: thiamine pyrophosphate-binding protein [Gordonia]|jgi:acetolactate synthase-1/2/3 large subunit|nr:MULTISPECIES: thiamine pyrophosphate-binding protein [Gordonia]MBD0021612.1 thiamine pyrophosphate-binding protein [Gordonia sp. (in: high G+C Gram-positive bacteria)]